MFSNKIVKQIILLNTDRWSLIVDDKDNNNRAFLIFIDICDGEMNGSVRIARLVNMF